MQFQDITKGPKLFIGLDVHKKTWSVSIQTDLFFHKTYSMPKKYNHKSSTQNGQKNFGSDQNRNTVYTTQIFFYT